VPVGHRPHHRRHVDAGHGVSEHGCILQNKLGNHSAAAFDVQAVCSGFVYALTIAEKFIRSGSHKCALVVGSPKCSRASSTGTTAAPACCSATAPAPSCWKPRTSRASSSALHADGRYHDILSVPGHVSGGAVSGDPLLQMDGQAVFKFAVRVLGDTAANCWTRPVCRCRRWTG
jgi:3-oxoacyl-[acyl-carrier-protein] synthase-3